MAVERVHDVPEWIAPDLVEEWVEAALGSLPRQDQRRWGDLYVRGLLSVPGRKTMRALATGAGACVEQSLQQFIAKSPWDWIPVRQEVARRAQQVMRPRAWVIEPIVITKVGRHSVGVERQYVSRLGRVANCQQGMGVWLASEHMSTPVDWRLALPCSWTEEPELRKRAAIPDQVSSCPPVQCALGSVTAMAEEWDLVRQPVVMDVRDIDPRPVITELTDHGIPFVLRISASAPLTTADPAPVRRGQEAGVAGSPAMPQLMAALRRQLLPVEWYDPRRDALTATLVGAANVRLLGRSPRSAASGPRQPLVLLGAWTDPGDRRPGDLWLSNMRHRKTGAIFRTAMLSRRVERDLAEVSNKLGIRDFEGRSFRGWHHHMTLVSLAHAITILSANAAYSSSPTRAAAA